MLTYHTKQIVFQEVPNEVSLAYSVGGCPNACEGCHSSYLAEETQDNLLESIPADLIANKNITTVLFLGGDHNISDMISAATLVKELRSEMKLALYSGMSGEYIIQNMDFYLKYFDYLKLGSYIEKLGGLNEPTTNQRLYKKVNNTWVRINLKGETI